MKTQDREAFRQRLTRGAELLGVEQDPDVTHDADSDPESDWGSVAPGTMEGGYPGEFGSAGTFQYIHGRDDNPLQEGIVRTEGDEIPSVSEESFVRVNQDIGGMPGLRDNAPYSIGPVGSNFIDTHAMRGQQLRVRSRALVATGPVGGQAYINQLQLQADQEVMAWAEEQASQMAVISGYAADPLMGQ